MTDEVTTTQDTTRVEQLAAEKAALERQLAETAEKMKTLQVANAQLNNELVTVKTGYEQTTSAFEQSKGELTNWATRYEQLASQHQTVAQQHAAAEGQLNLFKTIQGDPKYHGLLPVLDGIKTDPDPAKQKQYLDMFADTWQQQQQAIQKATTQVIQAGGVPTGGPGGGGSPVPSLPVDPKAAHAEYSQLLAINVPTLEQQNRRAQLQDYITKVQYGMIQPQRPA